jgi:Protein SET DOMAIN GROUP 2 C-terminal
MQQRHHMLVQSLMQPMQQVTQHRQSRPRSFEQQRQVPQSDSLMQLQLPVHMQPTQQTQQMQLQHAATTYGSPPMQHKVQSPAVNNVSQPPQTCARHQQPQQPLKPELHTDSSIGLAHQTDAQTQAKVPALAHTATQESMQTQLPEKQQQEPAAVCVSAPATVTPPNDAQPTPTTSNNDTSNSSSTVTVPKELPDAIASEILVVRGKRLQQIATALSKAEHALARLKTENMCLRVRTDEEVFERLWKIPTSVAKRVANLIEGTIHFASTSASQRTLVEALCTRLRSDQPSLEAARKELIAISGEMDTFRALRVARHNVAASLLRLYANTRTFVCIASQPDGYKSFESGYAEVGVTAASVCSDSGVLKCAVYGAQYVLCTLLSWCDEEPMRNVLDSWPDPPQQPKAKASSSKDRSIYDSKTCSEYLQTALAGCVQLPDISSCYGHALQLTDAKWKQLQKFISEHSLNAWPRKLRSHFTFDNEFDLIGTPWFDTICGGFDSSSSDNV